MSVAPHQREQILVGAGEITDQPDRSTDWSTGGHPEGLWDSQERGGGFPHHAAGRG